MIHVNKNVTSSKNPIHQVIAFMLVISMLVGFGVMSVGAEEKSALEIQYDTNAAKLDKMAINMDNLLVQIKGMETDGTLPSIDIFGISLGTYGLLESMVKGTNLLLFQIKGKQHEDFFKPYTASVQVGTSLGFIPINADLSFPNGIFNGSAAVDGKSIEAQPIEAKIAAQEYALYIGQAVEAMLTMVTLLDMKDLDLSALDSVKKFLEFDIAMLDSKKTDMFNSITNLNTVTLKAKPLITEYKKDVKMTDILNGSLGTGYNYLTSVRDILVPIIGDVTAIINILDALANLTSEEFLSKYETSDIGAILNFLTDDLASVESLLRNLEKLNPTILDLGISLAKSTVKTLISQFGSDALGQLGGLLGQLQIPELEAVINEFLVGETAKLEEMINGWIDGVTIAGILDIVHCAQSIVSEVSAIYNQIMAIVDKVMCAYEAIESFINCVEENATKENLDKVIAWGQEILDAYKAELKSYVCDQIGQAAKVLDKIENNVKAYMDKLEALCEAFQGKAEELCKEISAEVDAFIEMVKNPEPLTIIAKPGTDDVLYTLSTNYDCLINFVQAKVEKCTGKSFDCLEFAVNDTKNFVIDGNNLKAKGTLENKVYNIIVTYRLNINFKGHNIIVNLACKPLTINNYTEPTPVIESLHLNTNFIVSRYNAYINITANGENLEGHTVVVKIFDKEFPMVDGFVRVYLTKDEVPDVNEATYYEVIAYIDGQAAAQARIRVKPFLNNQWEVGLIPVGDGKMEIRFAEEVAPKTNSNFIVTVNGVNKTVSTTSDARVLSLDYTPIVGDVFEIKNVKFPDSFPSYTFSFTVTYEDN